MPFFQQTAYLTQLIDEAIESNSPSYQSKVAPLHALESQYGLFQLKTLLQSTTNEHMISALKNFLRIRWNYLKNTDMQYCQDFESPLNQVCIKISKILHTLTGSPSLCFLMPSLKKIRLDSYLTSSYDDENLDLRFLVLDDDASRIIHIEDVMEFAILDGRLKHNSLFGKKERELSTVEVNRLLTRHETVEFLFDAIRDKVQYQLHGETFGAYLQRLINGLTLGNVDHEGSELDAGPKANIAITEFKIFLSSLDDESLLSLMAMSTLYEACSEMNGDSYSLQQCWDRLVRKKTSDVTAGTYCVKMIGHELENILDANPEMYQMTAYHDSDLISLGTLVERMKQAKKAMITALESSLSRHLCYGAEHEQACIEYLMKKIAKNTQFRLNKESIVYIVEILYENIGQGHTFLIDNCRQILTHVHQTYSQYVKHQVKEHMSESLNHLFEQLNPKQTLDKSSVFFNPRKKSRLEEEHHLKHVI